MESLVTASDGSIWDLANTHVVAVQPGSATVTLAVLSSGATVNIHASFATVSAAFQATRVIVAGE
jgi:hypothetical protein